jgi:hypothetical protein
VPLRLSWDRVLFYGAILALVCFTQVRLVVPSGFGDWSAFWAAGATAGTHDLLDPHRHAEWQKAHHLLTTIFPYLPGAAWLLVPFKPLSLAAGYWINLVLMAVAAGLSALLASRIYGLARGFALVMAFAWAPTIAALATGQNSPIGLLLTLCAIAGLVFDSWLIAGLSVGLLLYKLPYALPMLVLLLARRNFRAVGVVVACGVVWFFASVAATAGDWAWPAHYAAALAGYARADAHYNMIKGIGMPLLLFRAGIPYGIACLAGLALFAGGIPLFARLRLLEVASLAPLLGVAASPHSLPYDLPLVLPALFYLMTVRAPEPLRTRVVCGIYVLAPLWLLSGVFRFDVLAYVCDGLAIVWLCYAYMELSRRNRLQVAA